MKSSVSPTSAFDFRLRPVAVNLDQIEMRQAIDQASRRDLADAPEIIGVNLIDVSTGKLFGAGRHAVEHLVVAFQVVHRTKNKIELVPVLLDPLPARRGRFRIVIQFKAGADFDIGICRAQFFDFAKIDPFVIAIVIGKGDVSQPDAASMIDPGLEELLAIGLDAMALRMRMVVGKRVES